MLADLHYSKAVTLFQLLKDTPCELLRVQLERVAFAEFQMAGESPFSWLQLVCVGLVPGWLGVRRTVVFLGCEEYCFLGFGGFFFPTVTLGRDQKSLHFLKCVLKFTEMD